jgi:hypothetical protein
MFRCDYALEGATDTFKKFTLDKTLLTQVFIDKICC